MRNLASPRAAISTALLLIGLSFLGSVVHGQESSAPSLAIPAAVSAAIEALGSPSFAARRQAESWLSASEHEAYDALLLAQAHANPEIRLAVRDLLERQRILWTRPTDSPEITSLLENYGNLNSADRLVVLQRLARQESLHDRIPLARLARYEPSEELSQRAALLLCEALPPLSPEAGGSAEVSESLPSPSSSSSPSTSNDRARPQWCRALERELAGGDRDSLAWLRTQLQWQDDPVRATTLSRSLAEARWKQHLGASPSSRQDRAMTVQLLRWSIELSAATGDPQAFESVPRFDDLLLDDGVAIREQLDWLASHQRWQEITAWSERHSERMHLFPEAALRVAEAWHRLEQPDHAATATQVAMLAFPKGFEDLETLAHGLAYQSYNQTASLLLEQAFSRTPAGSPERLRIAADLAAWDQAAGREADGANRLTQLLTEFEQLTVASLLVTPDELDRVRALQNGLLAEAEASSAGHWKQLTGAARERYLDHLGTALRYAPDQCRWLELAIEASETWAHPSADQWQIMHSHAMTQAQQRIDEYQHRLHATPTPTNRFRLERALKQEQLALAQLQLARVQTRAAGLSMLEHLTRDRQLSAIAWERLARVKQDEGDLAGALMATREAAKLTPRAVPQVTAAEQRLRQAESRSAARDSDLPQR